MQKQQFPFSHTSNDLLASLSRDESGMALSYKIVAQSVEDVQDIQNAPAYSMGAYLVDSDQTQLLTTISIYSQRGSVREQARLLYMNAIALRIWEEMGKKPLLIGAHHRPPTTTLLAFGVPFSE